MLDLEAIKGRQVPGHVWAIISVCDLEVLIDEVEQLRVAVDEIDEVERLRAALQDVKDAAAVCPDFEVCDHAACASSYAAWQIADVALREESERSPRA